MNTRLARGRAIWGVVIGLGLGLASASTPAWADAKEHVGEAVEHTAAAVKEGKLGNAEMLIEHADGALRYAKEARKTMQNDRLDTAIDELEAAVFQGRGGNVGIGTQHAENALEQLSAVK
jgi:hypothetical protein